MRIATWNVNSLRVRLPQVLTWLESNPVEILALQETKLPDPDFPADAIRAAGYECVYAGQRTYNGVAILSRRPVRDLRTEIPGLDDPQRRFLAASVDGLRVVNLYVPNGQSVDSEKYRYKLGWLAELKTFLGGELERHPELVVVGDFNIAPEPRDVHDPAQWEGKVLFSERERRALDELVGLGLTDTFRLFEQPERSFSWWDYRMNAFRRNRGLRIDHILASQPLARRCRSCRIDTDPRRWERPSDHAPVVAEFQ